VNQTLSSLDDLTPEWLTGRLRLAGHLNDESVASLQTTSLKGDLVTRLDVTYTSAQPGLPDRFVLKAGDAGGYVCVDNEVNFHRHIAGVMPDPPTAPWFDAAYDSDLGKAHILFQDLSRTHYEASDHATPGADCERLAERLATFQAHWWDHPDLGTLYGKYPAEDTIVWGANAESFAGCLANAVEIGGDRITPETISICERSLAAYPFKDLQGRTRLKQGCRLTFINHDLKDGNVFLPRDPSRDPVYIIDWAFWTIGIGTDDLANFGLVGFCADAGLTRRIVRRYHDRLVQSGVQDYTWDDCWHDYRLSTIRNLFIVLNSFRDREYSWSNLQRVLSSFKDLDCDELLNA
jgi:hypothetical protein